MMSFQPGGERTEPEYASLLARADFRLRSVTHLHRGQCMIVWASRSGDVRGSGGLVAIGEASPGASRSG
jgi:hypothetical protein